MTHENKVSEPFAELAQELATEMLIGRTYAAKVLHELLDARLEQAARKIADTFPEQFKAGFEARVLSILQSTMGGAEVQRKES